MTNSAVDPRFLAANLPGTPSHCPPEWMPRPSFGVRMLAAPEADLHWSRWRRHQACAQRSHYQRRLAQHLLLLYAERLGASSIIIENWPATTRDRGLLPRAQARRGAGAFARIHERLASLPSSR
ncbi:MAG: hypothetical protein ACXVCX_03790 [Ktedonobacterales bacterium]